MLQEKEAQKKQAEENKDSSKEEPIPGEKPVNISKKAQDWASENEWFGTDRSNDWCSHGSRFMNLEPRVLNQKVMSIIITLTNE